jgi:hypothetical protein
MPGPSIAHWGWRKYPDVKIEDGYLIVGTQYEHYTPGNYIVEILNDIQKVSDDETVLKFVRAWGDLGLSRGADMIEARRNFFQGAIEFTLDKIGHSKNIIDDFFEIDEVAWNNRVRVTAEVAKNFGYPTKNDFIDIAPKEKISDFIQFAQLIKNLSVAKHLFKLFYDDGYAANYETEEWIKTLSSDWKFGYLQDREFVEMLYEGCTHPYFNQFLLDILLSHARQRFSNRSIRGTWIQLYTGDLKMNRPTEGQPLIMFDGLFRFIEYVLLGEFGTWPKRCADPKCKQLFFPKKADQEYCPSPPGVRRSRCENRHGRELRRNGNGKKTRGQKPPVPECDNLIIVN